MSYATALLELARRQHGAVNRRQLLALGMSPSAIRGRLRRGTLEARHRGVYAVRGLADAHVREAAALLACGPQAALGRRSAASTWGFLPLHGDVGSVEVVGSDRRRRPGITARRVHLAEGDVTTLHGMRITTPPVTLLHLASDPSLPTRRLEQAVAEALDRGLTSITRLTRFIRSRRGQPGCTRLRRIIEGRPALTRSPPEEQLLLLVRRGKLPEPETNVRLAGYEVDFLWRDARLAVELDGFTYHRTRDAVRRDRDKDMALTRAGYTVVRIPAERVAEEPEAVLVDLAQLLG